MLAVLSAAGPPTQAQTAASPCDPTLRQAPENPWGYRQRGARCEGVFLREVGAVPLRVVALTEGNPHFDAGAGPLQVDWPTAHSSGTVQLRAESLRHRMHYRMDATVRQPPYAWPTEVLAAQGLAAAEVALTAGTRHHIAGQERWLLLPARLYQGRPASGQPVVLTLWPGLELEEVFLSLHSADGQALVDGRSLGRSFYPAERALAVVLPAVVRSGIYRVRVAAALRGGGSTSVDAWAVLVR